MFSRRKGDFFIRVFPYKSLPVSTRCPLCVLCTSGGELLPVSFASTLSLLHKAAPLRDLPISDICRFSRRDHANYQFLSAAGCVSYSYSQQAYDGFLCFCLPSTPSQICSFACLFVHSEPLQAVFCRRKAKPRTPVP